MVVADPVTLLGRTQIAQSTARYAVPVVASRREFVEAGALLSYGPHPVERWRRAAFYVDKLLKGANAAELPVEQPSTFELVINLKVAKSLGLTIPQLLLLQADQVIAVGRPELVRPMVTDVLDERSHLTMTGRIA